MKLNVGCGRNVKPGWINLDAVAGPGVDLVCDLARETVPLEDNCIDELLMSHVLEHLREPLSVLQELHRVAKPGAIITCYCPYGSSDDADEDPTHVRRIFDKSFAYFGQPFFWKADYSYRGDWRVERMILVLEPEVPVISAGWQEAWHRIRTLRNQVQEIICQMSAVKPIREARAELHQPVPVELASAEQWAQLTAATVEGK